ncbi:MAG: sulfur reduction protein DsrJ [Chromatiales bacterium]
MRGCLRGLHGLAYWIAALALGAAPLVALGDGLGPVVPQGKGEQCVEPVEVMRRDHMRFLLHHRDDTVHQGIRTKQYSLNECIVCHVQPDESGQFASSDSPEHFCNSCHSWAAVSIDCFQCHAAQPAQDRQSRRGVVAIAEGDQP